MFAIIAIVAALALPVDNFSYVAGSVVIDGVKTAAPARVAVGAYYSQYGRFPDSAELLEEPLPDMTPVAHVRSITIGEGARVVITFNTRNIDRGWSWWHHLLLRKPSDLTAQTLSLVPSTVGGRIAWDECAEGTVPKRNRHFKCPGHR